MFQSTEGKKIKPKEDYTEAGKKITDNRENGQMDQFFDTLAKSNFAFIFPQNNRKCHFLSAGYVKVEQLVFSFYLPALLKRWGSSMEQNKSFPDLLRPFFDCT